MAFNPAPSAWLDSWSEDNTDITLPIASLPELTALEADGATGDIRKVAYAIASKLYEEFNSRPVADRPSRMTITKGSSYNQATGQISTSISFTFVLAATGLDVAAES